MMMRVVLAVVLGTSSAACWAGSADEDQVRKAIAKLAPDAVVESVQPAPMPGIYHAVVGGNDVYVSADGKYLMNGALWDVSEPRNLTEAARALRRKAALSAIGPEQRIIFAAAKRKHTITVFTDLDCGYCRKLHENMAAYNQAGISVEYLLFPRGGLDSPSYSNAVSVWCADDQQNALTLAKQGQLPPPKICPNPIREEFQLGQRIGVGSTPTIVTESGTMLLGYLPPEQLLAQLEQTP